MIEVNISLENTDFLNSFDLLLETTIDKHQRDAVVFDSVGRVGQIARRKSIDWYYYLQE